MLSIEHEQICFICCRVADMPTTPRVSSVQLPCAGCDAPIWVPMSAPSLLPKICIRCLHTRLSMKPERQTSALPRSPNSLGGHQRPRLHSYYGGVRASASAQSA